MLLPTLHGVIRRRILVNYRVEPDVMQQMLPVPFRPRLHHGYAIAGISLLRLEQSRPGWLPACCGWSSENAAHRVAVEWTDNDGQKHDGTFILRRDTDSWLNRLTGGCGLACGHHPAEFEVRDSSSRLEVSMKATDDGTQLEFSAYESSFHVETVCFRHLKEAAAFFETGRVAYLPTQRPGHFEGIALHTGRWHPLPLSVERVESSFFSDIKRFPRGTAAFDHALLTRDESHEWRRLEPVDAPARVLP